MMLEVLHGRLLTLTGLGGSGKTCLASEVVASSATHFADGTACVPLQPIPRAELLVSAIAQTLGLTLYGQKEPQTQLVAFYATKPCFCF